MAFSSKSSIFSWELKNGVKTLVCERESEERKVARVWNVLSEELSYEGFGGSLTSGRASSKGPKGLGSSILALVALHLSWGEVGLSWVQD